MYTVAGGGRQGLSMMLLSLENKIDYLLTINMGGFLCFGFLKETFSSTT